MVGFPFWARYRCLAFFLRSLLSFVTYSTGVCFSFLFRAIFDFCRRQIGQAGRCRDGGQPLMKGRTCCSEVHNPHAQMHTCSLSSRIVLLACKTSRCETTSIVRSADAMPVRTAHGRRCPVTPLRPPPPHHAPVGSAVFSRLAPACTSACRPYLPTDETSVASRRVDGTP